MSTPLRYIPEEAKVFTDTRGRPIAVVEVTIRTLLGIFLLKPTTRNTSLILGVLGRAQERLDFELYGYAYLSNHGSLLVGVRSAQHLAAIMEFVHGNIARELGRAEQSDWKGRFWGRRGRPILILSDEDLVSRLRYLLSNSTKENLVTRPTRWPGAHCARALCTGKPDVGAWVNRTELRDMGAAGPRKRRQAAEADATTHYRIKLEKLPCYRHLTDSEYQQMISEMCRQIASEAAAIRKQTGGGVVGTKRLLRMSAHHRPEQLDTSSAPPVHCAEVLVKEMFLDAYRAFVDGYKAAYQTLNDRLADCQFPPGGVPPTCRRCPSPG